MIFYFSATGNTAAVAKSMATATESDIYEIRPSLPYTIEDLDWTDRNSGSSIESDDVSSRPSIADPLEDMSQYDATGNEARIQAAYANRDPRLAAIAITPYSTYEGGASGTAVLYTSRYPYRDWQAPSLDLRYGNNQYLLYPIRKFVTVGREYTNIGFNPVDVPIIRYADVLLSLAEAINEQGRWQEAVTYVNKVRSRAGVALLNTPGNDAVSVSSVEDMRVRIRNEKKWELACEEQLYCEELRWGTWDEDKFATGNGLQNVWGSPVYTYIWGGDAYLKWAIPQSEVEKNTNIKQNEGWN